MNKGLLKNKKIFDGLIGLIKKEKDENQQINLCKLAANVAVYSYSGQFSSNELESFILRYTEKINADIANIEYKPKTFLHVMTSCASDGGHTRVVLNWIKNSSEYEHSVLLLNQEDKPVPDWLKNSVKEENFIVFNNPDAIENAIKLRKIAAEYEYIVLHVHMYDFTPILAFGTKDFERPVIFFNHADHIFSVGISIADIFADLSSLGQKLTLEKRGAKLSSVLPVPLDINELKKRDKIESRKELKLPLDKKIIMSVGTSFKYHPFGKFNFIETSLKILKQNKDAIFIVIGPDKNEKKWLEAYNKSQGRLNAIGIIPKEKLNLYLNSADLYIESFPMGSATALLEVGILGVPVISLDTGLNHFDVVVKNVQVKSVEDLIERANDVLKENNHLENDFAKDIVEAHCMPGWGKYLKELIENTPRKHAVNKDFISYSVDKNNMAAHDIFTYNLTKSIYNGLIAGFDSSIYIELNTKNKLSVFLLMLKNRIFIKRIYLRMLKYLFKS